MVVVSVISFKTRTENLGHFAVLRGKSNLSIEIVKLLRFVACRLAGLVFSFLRDSKRPWCKTRNIKLIFSDFTNVESLQKMFYDHLLDYFISENCLIFCQVH